MKANEAPEKIYLTPLECMAASCQPKRDNTIEYIRTDVFIDKACKYLKLHSCEVTTENNAVGGWISDDFIDDFRKAMED